MKLIRVLLLLLGFPLLAAEPVLLVIENAIHDRLTNLVEYKSALARDGWAVEVLRYESRIDLRTNITRTSTNISCAGLNLSSSAATRLATTEIWPRVNAGLRHVFFIGELPWPVSGLDQCPDGHHDFSIPSALTPDGWRAGGSVNSAGAYRSPGFYVTPSPIGPLGWTDNATARQSLNSARNNMPGDGRFDQDYYPAGYSPKAAIGFLGGFGDIATDVNGLNRRAGVADKYLARNTAYRRGEWRTAGAVYEFKEDGPGGSDRADPNHSSPWWVSRAREAFGTNVFMDAKSKLVGEALTNRPIAFNLMYSGSSWEGSWGTKLVRPLTVGYFLRLSFNVEAPNGYLGKAILDSPNFGPLVSMPWDPRVPIDIRLLAAGKTFGQAWQDAMVKASWPPTHPSLIGDPTLRLK